MTSEDYFLLRKKETIEYFSKFKTDQLSIVGIDRSLTGTGISVVRNGILIESKEIVVKSFDAQRLIDITKQVMNFLYRYPNSFIVTENYAFNVQNSNSITGLAELWGILKVYLLIKGYKYLYVAPTTLKKYVLGTGIGPKSAMMMSVLKKFNFESKSDNIADAVGLAYMGYHSMLYYKKEKEDYTIKEIECFETFLNLEKKIRKKKKDSKQLAMEIKDE